MIVTITGSSGFVGRILCAGLRELGHEVREFDTYRGRVVDLVRRRYLGTATSGPKLRAARTIKRVTKVVEPALLRTRLLKPTGDDITDDRDRLAMRFRGSDAVVHLAGLAHPWVPGADDADFRRINYEGSVNVFEAAKLAGVPRFIFASSAQVYGINKPVRIDQFPILESNYCPSRAEGQTIYGFLKLEFERYMAEACRDGSTQGIALRMEFPGILSLSPKNFYVSTSVENLIAGYQKALDCSADFSFEEFNLADGEVEPGVVDIPEFVRRAWPSVPNYTRNNECLLGIGKARELLGYEPATGRTYFHASVAL